MMRWDASTSGITSQKTSLSGFSLLTTLGEWLASIISVVFPYTLRLLRPWSFKAAMDKTKICRTGAYLYARGLAFRIKYPFSCSNGSAISCPCCFPSSFIAIRFFGGKARVIPGMIISGIFAAAAVLLTDSASLEEI